MGFQFKLKQMEFIMIEGNEKMAYCKHCKLEISDDTKVCPFCQNMLKSNGEKGENWYPNVRIQEKVYHFILKLLLGLSIIVCGIMIFINLVYDRGVLWSILPSGIICYAWFAIRYCIFHNINVGAKIIIQMILAQVLLVFIDWRLGYNGWSLNFAFPGLILTADGAILILMLVNFMNWQSYLLYQIQLLLFSLIPAFFYWRHWIVQPIPTFLAIGISIVVLVGTIIFGTKEAKDELMRRFHI